MTTAGFYFLGFFAFYYISLAAIGFVYIKDDGIQDYLGRVGDKKKYYLVPRWIRVWFNFGRFVGFVFAVFIVAFFITKFRGQ